MSVKLARAIVRQQPDLAGNPMITLMAQHPEQTEVILPVLVQSTLQYRELKQRVPEQAKQIDRISRQVAMHKLGYYDGRS
jgi:hypothetical protein